MKIENISINDIKMADYNPRIISTDELQKLENSINEFGLVDPIIINLNNNTIIGGHQRFKVLKKQNINELKLIRFGDIGWIFSDENIEIKDENSEKALNIALNKISGEWDNKLLDDILNELKINDYDVSLTGFDEQLKKQKIEENKYLVILSFDNEDELNEMYNKYISLGYNCKKEIF